MLTLAILFDHFQFALIHGPNSPGSCAVLFFTASEFTSITSHIHHWVFFPLQFSLFILSGAISLLFPSSLLDSYQPGGLIFQCNFFFFFLPFCIVHGVLKARILKWFAISFSSGPCFVRTFHHDPSWVALHGMSHSFIELDKAVVHEISLNILFYHNSIPNLFGMPLLNLLFIPQ